ncbi:uncharacterized protein At4g18257-like [Silene latifolia]|uniref:uncharacterized protein At4g18257-like n=1 Tax=Silene latifolia TaxID=37657 RepID=UPI003D78A2C1
MGSIADEEKRNKRAISGGTESLGWLTESSIMPKKHKAIQGVGASSIMELKAELYKSQEESKKSKDLSASDVDYHRAKKKISNVTPFDRKNSGVENRAHLDKLALKAEKDGSNSYAALEKKAELYEKLAKGELSDEEDREKYCVDFSRKSLTEDEVKQQNNSSPAADVPLRETNEDDDFIPFNSKSKGLGRSAVTVDMDEHRRFIKEVHEEANDAREKVSEVKQRRQEHAAARREKLKQAYLRKRLENLKATAAAKQDQT